MRERERERVNKEAECTVYMEMLKVKSSHDNLIDNKFDKFTLVDIKAYHKHTNKTIWYLEKEKQVKGTL